MALVKLTTPEDDAENLRVMLLADLYKVFAGEWPPPTDDQDPLPIDRGFSETLVDFLREMKDRPWPYVCRGSKPITERWLARNLSVFGIHSKSMRIAEGNQKGYERADFDEVFGRYLDICDVPNVTRNGAVTETETEISIGKTDECDAVTAKKPKKPPHTGFFSEGTFSL